VVRKSVGLRYGLRLLKLRWLAILKLGERRMASTSRTDTTLALIRWARHLVDTLQWGNLGDGTRGKEMTAWVEEKTK